LGNLAGLPIERVEGDLLDTRSLRPAVEGCDTIFHLAAIYKAWMPDPSVMYRVNIHGTRALFAAALQAGGVERVVYTSSLAAVGVGPGEELASEETIFNDWLTADNYVLSKYMSELEALSFNLKGLPVVAVNPTLPIGSKDIAPTPTGDLVQRYVAGQNPTWLPGGANCGSVRDIAGGHWLAALRGRPGERYILGGENVSYKDFAVRCCRIAGVAAPKYEIKTGMVRFLGKINEWIADHVTHRTPMFMDKAAGYVGGRFLYVDQTKAKVELGYDPRPLDEAIADAVEWFRAGRAVALAK
ncbi:MAG: NAD-dependent epimerase/dehydratase family protein, partial [Myxococcales bacterium]|nr:NAD-dependent epimerase/dehydratase family protein [Myxococcales bacterium]